MPNILTRTFNRLTQGTVTGTKRNPRSAANFIVDVQLPRLKVDVQRWRESISEAERAYFPFRYKQQQMYVDTVLNGHTKACWERRKDLTLLRKFKICNPAGDEDEDMTKLFQKTWFSDFLSFSLDAQGFGYSLIFMGDVVDDEFKGTEIIKRWNISPDRLDVASFPYMPSGIKFLEDPEIAPWHIWVPTRNDIGTSPCGYGIFYEVAIMEIYLRSTLGFNVDYAQNYGQPIRKGTTTKTDEDERAVLFQALIDMGNSAAILLDPTDDLQLVETKGTGQGYKVYESLEARCEKKISKIILGHADAMDSTPGKLGAGQDGEESPVNKALMDKQTKDGDFVSPIVNKELLPRMREMGFNIPEGFYFEFKNDDEKEAFRKKQDASNLQTATIAKTMKDAGLQMDAKYFEERTGIVSTKIEPPPPPPPIIKQPLGEKITEKLKNLYK
jgi:hypothetical protein